MDNTPVESQQDEQPKTESKTSSSPSVKWYVLHSYAGQEKKAIRLLEEQVRLKNLSHLIKEIFIPTEVVSVKKGGQLVQKSISHFPGYILIQMALTDELWHIFKENARISGFIGNSQKHPQSLSEKELQAIKERINQGMKQSQIDSSYQVGDMVLIVDGPFMDFKGSVQSVDPDNGKMNVMVSIFGRSTPIELEIGKVKLATEEEE